MRAPRRRVLGLTWVGWLNFLLLRWLFVRLAYQQPTCPYYWLTTKPCRCEEHARFSVIRWVWPFPWARYRRVGS